jgi:hypothetical protein
LNEGKTSSSLWLASLKLLAEMKLQKALIDKAMECDPVVEVGGLECKRGIGTAPCPYIQIQNELHKIAKQMAITRFFQP